MVFGRFGMIRMRSDVLRFEFFARDASVVRNESFAFHIWSHAAVDNRLAAVCVGAVCERGADARPVAAGAVAGGGELLSATLIRPTAHLSSSPISP